MIFILKRDLNNFALFECIKDEEGRNKLTEMYESYLEVGKNNGCKMLFGSPTWRATTDHMTGMGYMASEVASYNKQAVEFMLAFRTAHPGVQLTIAGDVGPRGDGYVPDKIMKVEEAKAFHSVNIGGLVAGGAELIQALTMNYWEEAAGVVLATKEFNLPVSIYFTVETDGKLVGGMTLQEAIKKVDEMTDNYASHFGVNCAHPTHCKSSFEGLDQATL